MTIREAGSELFAELFAVAWEHKAEWTTEDNAIWVEGNGNRGKTEKHAVDHVGPDVFFGDGRDEAAIFGIDGARGGNIFPFFGFAFVDELGMARFEVGIALNEGAIFDDAATDAGGEGEVERATLTEASLGEGGKIGVVFDVGWDIGKVALEKFGEIKVVPRKIAKPDGLIALDDARHSDGNSFNAAQDEIDADLLKKILVKDILIRDGRKADRMENVAVFIYERDDGFGASNVDTEIHNLSIASLGQEGNNR